MFEVGVARTFHALHQLEAEDPDASHEHSHDYRAEVVARANASTRTPCWSTSTSSGRHWRNASRSSTPSISEPAAFADRNTTVETVAEHIWTHVRDRLARPSGLAGLRVTVYESADAWASVDRPAGDRP